MPFAVPCLPLLAWVRLQPLRAAWYTLPYCTKQNTTQLHHRHHTDGSCDLAKQPNCKTSVATSVRHCPPSWGETGWVNWGGGAASEVRRLGHGSGPLRGLVSRLEPENGLGLNVCLRPGLRGVGTSGHRLRDCNHSRRSVYLRAFAQKFRDPPSRHTGLNRLPSARGGLGEIA